MEQKDILFASSRYVDVLNLSIIKAFVFIFKKRIDGSTCIPVFNHFILCMNPYYQLERYNAIKIIEQINKENFGHRTSIRILYIHID